MTLPRTFTWFALQKLLPTEYSGAGWIDHPHQVAAVLFRSYGKGMKWNVRVEPVAVTLAQPGRLKPAPHETWPS